MPVYKGDNLLSEAVDSILNQTFSDFEMIIICDDPTHETRLILGNYQQNDSRMRVYFQKRQGLVNSLNKGFSLAFGKYIARMDADDISLPHRFERQVEFMDKNPDIGISGTWVKAIGDIAGQVWKYPCDHRTMKSQMLFQNALAHPSVIIRKNSFFENRFCYNQDDTYAEDYALWVRSIKNLKFANIHEILLHYRVHKSNTDMDIQRKTANKIRLSQINELGIKPTKAEFEIHELVSYYEIKLSKDFIIGSKLWLEKLQKANSKVGIYPEPEFSRILAYYWYHIFEISTSIGLDSLHLLHKSTLKNYIDLSNIRMTNFYLRALRQK
jgi:glycosyltransferase involved in cell wall biosynthesis